MALASKHLAVFQPHHARATTPQGACTAAGGLDAETLRWPHVVAPAGPARSRLRHQKRRRARGRFCPQNDTFGERSAPMGTLVVDCVVGSLDVEERDASRSMSTALT